MKLNPGNLSFSVLALKYFCGGFVLILVSHCNRFDNPLLVTVHQSQICSALIGLNAENDYLRFVEPIRALKNQGSCLLDKDSLPRSIPTYPK